MSKKKWSRREWLKGVCAGGVGSLVFSNDLMGDVATSASKDEDASGNEVVPTRPFGKTGLNVSSLALGGMFDIPSNQLLLKQALKWGVTYWDTADCYGNGQSEKGIGKFFSKHPEARRKIFLVTKSDERDPRGMTELLSRSLKRMKTDYIDLYFIHGVSHIDELNSRTKRWVEKAKAQGKIKLFGFSTHSNMETCLTEAAKLDWIDGIMMTYNFRLMHTQRMRAAVEACVKTGIGLTAMKTQGGGLVRTETETELKLAGKFVKLGFTDKQAKLKAIWENRHIASICSQMPNITILMSNVQAALDKTKLTAETKRLLARLAEETEWTYCAGCAHYCESATDEEVPIGDVMRYLMYYHNYTNHDQVRTRLAELPQVTQDRLRRLDFSAAERQCPHGLQIGKLLREAVELPA